MGFCLEVRTLMLLSTKDSIKPQILLESGLTGIYFRGGGSGGQGALPPVFGRIEGAARQRRRAALLLAHPDFQTLRHPCINANKSWKYVVVLAKVQGLPNIFSSGNIPDKKSTTVH